MASLVSPIAQLVERAAVNLKVAGSNPAGRAPLHHALSSLILSSISCTTSLLLSLNLMHRCSVIDAITHHLMGPLGGGARGAFLGGGRAPPGLGDNILVSFFLWCQVSYFVAIVAVVKRQANELECKLKQSDTACDVESAVSVSAGRIRSSSGKYPVMRVHVWLLPTSRASCDADMNRTWKDIQAQRNLTDKTAPQLVERVAVNLKVAGSNPAGRDPLHHALSSLILSSISCTTSLLLSLDAPILRYRRHHHRIGPFECDARCNILIDGRVPPRRQANELECELKQSDAACDPVSAVSVSAGRIRSSSGKYPVM
uniref:Uncharacterized protein n=1 Tax=Peronospora matthiolae TaxID=2874970 RepID=A0AAV1UHW6_9STRA